MLLPLTSFTITIMFFVTTSILHSYEQLQYNNTMAEKQEFLLCKNMSECRMKVTVRTAARYLPPGYVIE